MTRPRGLRFATLTLVTLGLACGGDTPTAPNATSETVLVALTGIAPGDAGIVLELTGAAEDIQSASASLDVAWVWSATNVVTVAIVGPLADGANVLTVRRRTGLEPMRVEVREVAAADGSLSSPSPARALVRAANSS
jgi:hypothetical protein